VGRAEIPLVDEPLSHLDEPLRVQMRSELRALRSRLNLTSIYVTHDQAEALALGDRVAVLSAGKLQQVGDPHEIYEMPSNTFVAGFIGVPAMNLFQGTIAQREGGLLFLGAEGAEAGSAFVVTLGEWHQDWFSQNIGRRVWLGIRPESVQLAEEIGGRAVGITAVVQSVEYAGAEIILRLASGGRSLVTRRKAGWVLKPGQMATVTLDLNQARIYDAATGALLL